MDELVEAQRGGKPSLWKLHNIQRNEMVVRKYISCDARNMKMAVMAWLAIQQLQGHQVIEHFNETWLNGQFNIQQWSTSII